MANTAPTAVESFGNIARDRRALGSFLSGIGDERAPSRVRAAELLADCESVVDVGCGPAVTWKTLAEHGSPVLRYLGVDPVDELLNLASAHGLPQFAAGTLTLRSWSAGHGDASCVVHAPKVVAFLVDGAGCADAVILRHVIEHLPSAEAMAMLYVAAGVARRKVFVAVSAATRVDGMPRSLLTDTFLGAWRWSHWRPDVLDVFGCRSHPERAPWMVVAHERGAGLAPNEELFCFERVAR